MTDIPVTFTRSVGQDPRTYEQCSAYIPLNPGIMLGSHECIGGEYVAVFRDSADPDPTSQYVKTPYSRLFFSDTDTAITAGPGPLQVTNLAAHHQLFPFPQDFRAWNTEGFDIRGGHTFSLICTRIRTIWDTAHRQGKKNTFQGTPQALTDPDVLVRMIGGPVVTTVQVHDAFTA